MLQGHYQESEKTTHRMGEDTCKSSLVRDLLYSEYIKKVYSPIIKRQISQLNSGQRMWQTFLKEEIVVANKHMKRCSTSLVTK